MQYNLLLNNNELMQINSQKTTIQSYQPSHPYTPNSHNYHEAQPLRTKAFSHTDNLPEHPSSPTKQNNDRIQEIKRKYDKIFIKSNGKSLEESQGNGRNMMRHSQLQMNSQSFKYSNSNKYNQYGAGTKENSFIESQFDESSRNTNQRDYLKKDYSVPKNTDMKSQIDYNRATLTNMKSQLNHKLNDVYTKTSSSISKPTETLKSYEKNSSLPFNSNQKLSSEESLTYEAIINKYSKSINSKTPHSSSIMQGATVASTLSKIEPEHYTNYKKKYDIISSDNGQKTALSSKYTEPAKKYQMPKERDNRRQLSIISEISNSNNSEMVKEASLNQEQALGKSLGKSSNSVIMNRRQCILQSTKYNAESKIIIEKPMEKYSIQRPSSKYERNYEIQQQKYDRGVQKQYGKYADKSKLNYSEGVSTKEAGFRQSASKENNYKETSYKEPSYKESHYKEPSFDSINYKEPSFKEPYFKETYKEPSTKYIEKDSKYDDKKWYKNTNSYFDELQMKQPTKNYRDKQETNQYLQFTLNKLQNNQQFTIKRTVTEEHFMNLNKANYMQTKNEYKSKTGTNFMPSKHGSNYEAFAEDMELKDNYNYTKVKYGNHTPNSKENRAGSVHEPSKSYNEDKTEIDKLKDKYKINSSHSKSTIEEKTEKSANTLNKSENRNNQSISKEIERLDERIRMIQQNKKELNLNFKPFEMTKSSIRSTQNSNGVLMAKDIVQREKMPSKEYTKYSNNSPYASSINTNTNSSSINANTNGSIIKNQAKAYTNNSTINAEKGRTNIRNQTYLERIKPIYSEITLPQSAKNYSNPFSIKLIPVQKDEDFERQINDSTSKSRTKEYMNKLEIQSRTDCGIEERKKKLQDQVQMKNHLKNLVKSFGQQACLDENFRNNKIWFASERNDNKWNELHSQIHKSGLNYTINQLKIQFQLLQSENNPFFSITDHKCDIRSLVHSYLQSKNHWDEKIFKQYERLQIEKEGFNNSKLDADRKGYIQIQDFVRFLNIQSGTFLRNRDLSIIFRRINHVSDKITYEQLINVVSH